MPASSTNSNTQFVAGVEQAKEEAPPNKVPVFSQNWTNTVNAIRSPILKVILFITDSATATPRLVVASTIILSLALVTTGLFTNFNVDVDENTLWSPQSSFPKSHSQWIDKESGFQPDPRSFFLLVHRNGENVLGHEGVRRVFSVVDLIRQTEGYQDLCSNTGHVDMNGIETCYLVSVTNFWNDTAAVFESIDTISNSSTSEIDEATIAALSASTFPSGAKADTGRMIGKPRFDEDGLLEFGSSYVIFIDLPESIAAERFETKALDQLLQLRADWAEQEEEENNDGFRLEFFADRSFSDEFTRAIVTDIPLVPIVFTIMSIFTCVVFARRDWVYSRSLLGFGAVTTVLLAIMTGYGILFLLGTPFTSMTQILPFIMFGIGLDNAFIISGEYERTDKTKDAPARVHDTIEQVGLSIFLTTTTSVVAFALGMLSSIPAVIWLCEYAAPTIFINFLFQLTFFVALIVIDERRVQEKRRDWLVCSTVKNRVDDDELGEHEDDEGWFDRFMEWYANALINPFVGGVVIVVFTGVFAACVYSASLLTQDFQFTDVVPGDSYVADFWNSFTAYNDRSGVRPGIYFRYQDQCDPEVQNQMLEYVNELVALDEVKEPPFHFWLRDFQQYVNGTENIQEMSCEDQIAEFLQVPQYSELYSSAMVIDDGTIVASRTFIEFSNVDQEVVTEQVDALLNQRRVTKMQPPNQNTNDWSFFTLDGLYFIWEFYSVAPRELTQTTIAGVVAVSLLGMFFIPHWTAILFVAPMISILYVDLLGVLQYAGLHVNAVSYISLVMSIGLLVDFLMHILLRYYESEFTDRKAKVKDTLKTMGASILVGGISTFLGVIPLAFSTSEIFNTIFVTFVGLVTLGAGHGLILLPVLLSLFGPAVSIKQINTNITNQAGDATSSKVIQPSPGVENDGLDVDDLGDESEYDA